jgi:hypothetical protein
MEINPGKKRDLRASDYPTAGWLNHIHGSLQEIRLSEIGACKKWE